MFHQPENHDFGMATLLNHYLHWLRFEVTIIRQIWMFHGGFAAAFHPWLNGSKDLMRYHRPKYVIMHKTSKGFLLRMGQVWAKSRQASTRANSRRVPKLKRTKDVLLIPKVCRQKFNTLSLNHWSWCVEKKHAKSSKVQQVHGRPLRQADQVEALKFAVPSQLALQLKPKTCRSLEPWDRSWFHDSPWTNMKNATWEDKPQV